MSRMILAAVAALALLAGCGSKSAQPEPGPAPEAAATPDAAPPAEQRRLTVAAHALFVDVCVRNLGQAEALRRRAAQRNMVLIRENIRLRSAPTEALRLYGIQAPDGGIAIGMVVNGAADNCAVAVMQPETGLALALASEMALVWTRDGSRVTPVAAPSQPDIDARIYYRVQSTGVAARQPAADWIFGVTLARDGSGLFQALLSRRRRPGAPVAPDAAPPAFVPRGILRNAAIGRQPGLVAVFRLS